MRWTSIILSIFPFCFSWSNPIGHHVVHGDAHVTNLENTCHIHATDQTIIHWEDFSIGASELTHFIQPSENSVILNRVIGDLPSEILGTLHANGKLFLLNHNGILFGENAIVNVGELIASTLALSDEDFLKGQTLHFHGPSQAAITNHGTIRAATGNVTLLSRQIINPGTLQAPEGNVELIAATDIFLQPQDKKRILIRVASDDKKELGIYHQGKIAAIETYLQADGNLYELAIKDEGEIDALVIKEQGGRVYLAAENGSLSLAGKIKAPRGEITALAQNVFVLDNADLSVSDLHKPGQIHLGKGSDITFVAEKAHLEANALKHGTGGKVLCLSDGTSLFLGEAELRGGLYGGDGGFIEVSGTQSTHFHGTTDRFAPFGKNGDLLLDPEANFTISSIFDYNYETLLATKTPIRDLANLTIATLLTELQKGPVTIQTSFEGDGGLPGHIKLCSDVSQTYASPHSLTLYSTGREGIIWNGSLINTGKGDIELVAPNGKVLVTPSEPLAPALIQTAGNIRIQTDGSVEIEGAEKCLAGLKATQSGQISILSKEDISLTSAEKAPAFIHTENGSLSLVTPGRLILSGKENTPSELRSLGMGDITIRGAQSIQLNAETGPALISFSHRYGNLLIDGVKESIELNALGDTAAIEGGLGSLTLKKIGSDINLLAEANQASISSIGAVTIQTEGGIHLDAADSNATISSNNLLHITVGKNLLLTAEDGNASITSPQGMMLHAHEDLLLSGTAKGQAFFRGPNSHIFAGHDLELFSHTRLDGGNGPLLISIGNDFSMSNPFHAQSPTILGASLNITIGHNLYLNNDASLLTNAGSLFLSIGDTAYFADATQLKSREGPLTIQTLQGNIYCAQHTTANTSSGGLNLSAGKSIILDGFSHLESHGQHGVTIIVDALHPKAIGTGGFVLGQHASLSSGNAPIEIYTAKRSQNAINGTLNGLRIAAAPLYINTKEEQWGIFYLQTTSTSPPFTVFHKENGLIKIGPKGVTQKEFTRVVVNFTGPYTAELFRDLHPYNEYTADSESFTVTYPKGSLPKEDTFSIKRPTFHHRSVQQIYN